METCSIGMIEMGPKYPKKKIILFTLSTVFTLSIQTPQLLTILLLKFEQVQFITQCCV